MSRSGPTALIQVGDNECWDNTLNVADRNIEHSIGANPRRVRRLAATNLNGIVPGRLVRAATPEGWYAELHYVVSSGNRFGLITGKGFAFSPSKIMGGVDSVAYLSTQIAHNNAIVQGGLTAAGTGTHVGLRYYTDGIDNYVQFYVNRVAVGTPVEVTFESARLGYSSTTLMSEGFLLVDHQDLIRRGPIPDGACAWGAAIRVADVGGYSPKAIRITRLGANVDVDVGGRRISGFPAVARSAYTDGKKLTGFVYVEGVIEQMDGGGGYPFFGVGVNLASTASHPGFNTQSWGYSPNGRTYHNSVASAVISTYGLNDRPGAIVNVDNGKLWFTKNGQPIQGNPVNDTSPNYSGLPSTLCFGAAPAAGAIRMLFHPDEQKYRPVYCGGFAADLMPDVHFAGRLTSNPSLERRIHFPVPWGGSLPSGSPMGSIDVDNTDGKFDGAVLGNIRDQTVIVMREVNNELTLFARLRADNLLMDSEQAVRVLLRDPAAELDVPAVPGASAFCVGTVWIGKAAPLPTDPLKYIVGHSGMATMSVLEKGGNVTGSSSHLPEEDGNGFRRSTVPIGKVVGKQIVHYRPVTQDPLVNGDFSVWKSDNPDGWTVSETAPSSITQSGSAARFIRSGPADLWIRQAIPDRFELRWVKITFSSVTSGQAILSTRNSSFFVHDTEVLDIALTGPGTYWVPLNSTDLEQFYLQIDAGPSSDFIVDNVELWTGELTSKIDGFLRHMLVDCKGWTEDRFLQPYTYVPIASIGYQEHGSPNIRQVLERVLTTDSLGWYFDRRARMVIGALFRIASTAPSEITLYENDLLGELTPRDDLAPNLSDAVTIRHVYDVHSDTDIITSVTGFDRATLQLPYEVNRLTDDDVDNVLDAGKFHPFYSFANGAEPVKRYNGLFETPSQTYNPGNFEVALWYWKRIYSERRRFWQGRWPVEKLATASPDNLATLHFERFGLDGKQFYIAAIGEPLLDGYCDVVLFG